MAKIRVPVAMCVQCGHEVLPTMEWRTIPDNRRVCVDCVKVATQGAPVGNQFRRPTVMELADTPEAVQLT